MIRFSRLTILLVIVIQQISFAQSFQCGYDQFRSELISRDVISPFTEQQQHYNMYEKILSNRANKSSFGAVTIPVVFHIMHDNGAENVDDSLVVNAVEELNLRFQNAPPYFDSTGNPVNIQFCLATVDPQGNPTTGITRHVTPLTVLNSGYDEDMKSISRWSPLLYCNIFIVREIVGWVAGYASYPYWAGSGFDGIVMEYYYLNNSHVLAHEMGHYCGLGHTFMFWCNNFNCMLDGDQVCDTPPDTSQLGNPCMINSCSTDAQDTTGLSPFLTDVNELPNYMDYTSCPLSFTQGQAERMETLVNTFRPQLFASNACGNNPGQPAPVAGFNFSVSPCNNGVVTFSDTVAFNILTSEWDFDNNGIYEIMSNGPQFTFPASGTYLVRQRVTGYGGQDTISHNVTVMKGLTFNYPIVTPAVQMDTILTCGGDSLTFGGDPSGVSFLWSTGDTTSTITIAADSSMDISLIMTDANGFTWNTQCTPIHIEVYPSNIPIITYDDSVGYLCQGELVTLYVSNPVAGLYTWQVYHISTGWFNTGDHNLSYTYSPDPANGSQFYVTYTNPAGCNQQSNTVTVQPHYLPFFNGVPLFVSGFDLSYNTSGYQYQWYNYNIPIPGANLNWYTVTSTGCYSLYGWDAQYPECDAFSDTVCFMFTGLEKVDENIFIYPNPVKDEIHISGIEGNMEYEIFNVTGKIVLKGNLIQGESIDVIKLPSGIYSLNLNAGNKKIRHKLMVVRE